MGSHPCGRRRDLGGGFLLVTLVATGYAFKLAFEVRGAPDQARIGQFAAHLGRSYWWVLQILLTVPAAVWAVRKVQRCHQLHGVLVGLVVAVTGFVIGLHDERSDDRGVRADGGRRLARRRHGCASSNEAGSRPPNNALNLTNAARSPRNSRRESTCRQRRQGRKCWRRTRCSNGPRCALPVLRGKWSHWPVGSWALEGQSGEHDDNEQAAPETKGVTVRLLATVDLGPRLSGMAGRQLRMRLRDLDPGGVFGPIHDHRDRPGTVYYTARRRSPTIEMDPPRTTGREVAGPRIEKHHPLT